MLTRPGLFCGGISQNFERKDCSGKVETVTSTATLRLLPVGLHVLRGYARGG